jgi:hypothetical protein
MVATAHTVFEMAWGVACHRPYRVRDVLGLGLLQLSLQGAQQRLQLPCWQRVLHSGQSPQHVGHSLRHSTLELAQQALQAGLIQLRASVAHLGAGPRYVGILSSTALAQLLAALHHCPQLVKQGCCLCCWAAQLGCCVEGCRQVDVVHVVLVFLHQLCQDLQARRVLDQRGEQPWIRGASSLQDGSNVAKPGHQVRSLGVFTGSPAHHGMPSRSCTSNTNAHIRFVSSSHTLLLSFLEQLLAC